MRFDTTGARIMIVDDQELHTRLLRTILQIAGFTNVTTCNDPRQAIDLFKRLAPDIVLLDLMMFPFDGFSVMRQIHEVVGDSDEVPIVFLTADVNPDHRHRALAEGAKDFLSKPFDHDEVVLRIRNLLETRFLYLRLRELAEGVGSLFVEGADSVATAAEELGSSF
ncbi:MAG: response regulator [Actinomycetota bacterium]